MIIGLSASVGMLFAGIFGTTWGLLRAREQRHEAQVQAALATTREAQATREAARAKRVAVAMERILTTANPQLGTSASEGTISLLEQAAKEISADLEKEPEVEWRFRCVLGQTFQSIGALHPALESFRRADELAVSTFGPEHVSRLDTLRQVASAMCDVTTYGTATPDIAKQSVYFTRDALANARRVLGSNHVISVSMLNSASYVAAYVNIGEIARLTEQDRENHAELVALLRTMSPGDRPCPLSFALTRLAMCCESLQDKVAAKLAAEEATALFLSGTEPDDDDTVCRQMGLPDYYTAVMRLHEAGEVLRTGIERLERIRGPSHSLTRYARYGLVGVYCQLERFAEARALLADTIAVGRPLSKRRDPALVYRLTQLGHLGAFAGRVPEASIEFKEAMDILRHNPSSRHDSMLREYWRTLACITGFRTHGPWASDVLKHECRWAMSKQLDDSPSAALDADDLRWDRFEFQLSEHGQDAKSVHSGTLADLWMLGDPTPGIHRLTMSVPEGSLVRRTNDWIFVAPWHIRKYASMYRKITEIDEWNARIAEPPDEELDSSTVTAMGWWGRGFGPVGREYCFGLVAETTVEFSAGEYTFELTADDGGKVILDGKTIIDMWPDSRNSNSWKAQASLAQGAHSIRVEYVQWGDMSRLRLQVTPEKTEHDGDKMSP